jgi:hypothetical protein
MNPINRAIGAHVDFRAHDGDFCHYLRVGLKFDYIYLIINKGFS